MNLFSVAAPEESTVCVLCSSAFTSTILQFEWTHNQAGWYFHRRCAYPSSSQKMFTTKYCRTLVCFWFYATLSRGSGFQHSTVLDPHGKYHLKWSFNRETITFEVEVETTGYVGFGLSPNGAMASSDIVIGGVVDGTPYLQVRLSLPFHKKITLGFEQSSNCHC